MATTDTRPFGLRILGSPDEPARMTRVRVQGLLTALIISSNVLGSVTVFILATFVIPGPQPHDYIRVIVLNMLVGLGYTAVAVATALKWGSLRIYENATWMRSGRRPTEAEQRFILRLPLLITRFQASIWLVGAGLFALFNAELGDHFTVQIFLTVLLGGFLVCTNTYFLGELVNRPLAARALASGPPERLPVPGVRGRAVLAWVLSSAVPVSGLMVVAAAALVRNGITTTRLAVTVLGFGGLAVLFGSRIVWIAARANSDPIKGLQRAVQQVERGDLEVAVPIYDGTEIGQLQAGFNRMAAGLREREHIMQVFEHHVGEDVARTALESEAHLGGNTFLVGVLFVDIIGSTNLAGRLSPDEVVTLLNRFFAVVVDVIDQHGGAVNKFEGDGALAVFGAPTSVPDPAGAALAAGRHLAEELAAHESDFEAGIGISAGSVVAGNIGATARYEYTVIGDPVNEAARLTDLAKGVKGRVLASWTSVEQAAPGEAEHWVKGKEVALRGRPGRTRVATPEGR